MSEEKSLVELVKEKQKIEKEIKEEKLKIPKTPKKPTTPKKTILKIDFDKIAKKSYFQRFIQNLFKDILPEQFKGIDFHTSRNIAVKKFDTKINEINEIYDVVEQLKQEKKGDYKGVMNEFKGLLKKIKKEN